MEKSLLKSFKVLNIRSINVKAFLCLLLILVSCDATSEVRNGLSLSHIKTVKGDLELVKEGDSSDTTYLIKINGKEIKKENEYYFMFIRSISLRNDVADLVLLGVGSGGTVCPENYKIVDLSLEDGIFISQEFGNCLEDAILKKVKKNYVVEMPSLYSDKKKAEWIYSKRKIKQISQ